MQENILLSHGAGGKSTRKLIRDIFIKHFDNNILNAMNDSAVLKLTNDKIAFTTDSFVINPVIFPGGDIGKLAVCGTVNDIAVSGANPLYLSASFIIEEGLGLNLLERIVISMADEAKKAGVKIVTGDTKVVGKGECDKIYINTTGIGIFDNDRYDLNDFNKIKPGDKVIINGFIGDHEIAVLKHRQSLELPEEIISDCACLNKLVQKAMNVSRNIKFCRDATRGGLATVLCEAVDDKNFGITIYEDNIPVRGSIIAVTDIFGFDPLYLANEGKVVMIVDGSDVDKIIDALRLDELGVNSLIIGEVTSSDCGKVVMETRVGGRRFVDMLYGAQLPRIC
jgi:hydrogenase expression/formation protein HypE